MSRALVVVALVACAPPDPSGQVRLAFERLDTDRELVAVTDFRFLPGGDEALLLEKAGRVVWGRVTDDAFVTLGTVALPDVYDDNDCGLVSLAIDPGFATNRFVYVGACLDLATSVIWRLTLETTDLAATPASVVEILRAQDILADRPWHNVGAMGFEPDGIMWALIGDKSVPSNGQSTDDVLGAVVRIVPSRDPDGGGHEAALDNPWIDVAGYAADMAAIGLRSPWRGAMDSRGRLWLGDVGAERTEEIDVLETHGENFGWPLHEGPCVGECTDMTDPIVSWPHDGHFDLLDDDPEVTTSLGRVAWVGIEHRGGADDPYDGALAGRMLYGDFCLGFVRAATLDDGGAIVDDVPLGHLAHPSAWDEGRDGFLYATTFGGCESTGAQQPSAIWRAVLD